MKVFTGWDVSKSEHTMVLTLWKDDDIIAVFNNENASVVEDILIENYHLRRECKSKEKHT